MTVLVRPDLKRASRTFQLVGRTLFGEAGWQGRLAFEIQVSELLIRRWCISNEPIPLSAWTALEKICRARGNALLELADKAKLASENS